MPNRRPRPYTIPYYCLEARGVGWSFVWRSLCSNYYLWDECDAIDIVLLGNKMDEWPTYS